MAAKARKPFDHTVNSAEDRARLERLIREAHRRINTYMLFAGSHEVKLFSRVDHKGDTHDLGKRCEVWEDRIKAWDRSQEILERGIERITDINDLIVSHVVRNGWEDRSDYAPLFTTGMTIFGIHNLFYQFGYSLNKGKILWHQAKE